MAEPVGVHASDIPMEETAEVAYATLSDVAHSIVEVRLPTARTTSSTWLPQSRMEKVAETGGGLTLLDRTRTSPFCPMPQDRCFGRGVGRSASWLSAQPRPMLQHDRLHRHIHRHGWRSRDVERHVPEPTSPRRYVLPAPLFSLEPRADAQPHLFTASRPIHSSTPSHPGCAARRCSCQMC